MIGQKSSKHCLQLQLWLAFMAQLLGESVPKLKIRWMPVMSIIKKITTG